MLYSGSYMPNRRRLAKSTHGNWIFKKWFSRSTPERRITNVIWFIKKNVLFKDPQFLLKKKSLEAPVLRALLQYSVLMSLQCSSSRMHGLVLVWYVPGKCICCVLHNTSGDLRRNDVKSLAGCYLHCRGFFAQRVETSNRTLVAVGYDVEAFSTT